MAVQACATTYPSRIRTGNTALLTGQWPGAGGTPAANGLTGRTSGRLNPSRALQESSSNGLSGEAGAASTPLQQYHREIEQGDARGMVERGPPASVMRRQRAHRTRHIPRTDEQLAAAAEVEEVLIPIRLDIDLDNFRVKDVFLWNMNESLITPDAFAQTLCADLDIPASVYAAHISTVIRTQIEEYAPVAEVALPSEHEMRMIVRLSLQLARHYVTDQFEWSLTSPLAPARFASVMCADMGLRGEFVPAIAHAIHEELLKLKKEACEGALTDDLDNDAPPGQFAGVRVDPELLGAMWQPTIEVLSRDEMERREVDREREVRRLRRDASRFGGSGADRSAEQWQSSASADGSFELLPSATVADVQTLTDAERPRWRCQWCLVPGTGTWAVRRGPNGNKTLCNPCGVAYARSGTLPSWRMRLHAHDV